MNVVPWSNSVDVVVFLEIYLFLNVSQKMQKKIVFFRDQERDSSRRQFLFCAVKHRSCRFWLSLTQCDDMLHFKKMTILLESRTQELVNMYIGPHYQIQNRQRQRSPTRCRSNKNNLIRFWDFFLAIKINHEKLFPHTRTRQGSLKRRQMWSARRIYSSKIF